jgi:hypothetical protein
MGGGGKWLSTSVAKDSDLGVGLDGWNGMRCMHGRGRKGQWLHCWADDL